jgi:hypothetical protein
MMPPQSAGTETVPGLDDRELVELARLALVDPADRGGEDEQLLDQLAGRMPGGLPRQAWDRQPDPNFARTVADHFDRQPLRHDDPGLDAAYAVLAAEALRQFRALRAAGIEVLPRRGTGQPHQSSADLRNLLRRTGKLHVLLSRDGHGPPGSPARRHPMLAPAGVEADGEPLTHNDVLRAVHDVFGHVLLEYPMGPAGEFAAARCHLAMLPPAAHGVLFTEQVSQACWFFYGAHLRTASGRLPRRGEPGWLPPQQRPYPAQKVFPCPPSLLQRFVRGEDTRPPAVTRRAR